MSRINRASAFVRVAKAVKVSDSGYHSNRTQLVGLILRGSVFLVILLSLDRIIDCFLKHGLEKYYGLENPAKVLLIGHSHTVLGVDKKGLENDLGVQVAKFAVEGANTADRLQMIQHYIFVQSNSVKVVVYDVDAHTFTASGLSSSSFRLFLPFMESPGMSDYVRRGFGGSMEFWVRRFIHCSRYGDLLISLSVRGYLGNWSNLKRGQVDILSLRKEVELGRFRRIEFNQEVVGQFETTLKFLRSRGIKVVLAYIPTLDIFNQAEPDLHKEVIDRFRRYADADSGIVFLDYNRDYESRHDYFFDHIHMNADGQRVVTLRLGKDLKPLLQAATPTSGPNGNN